MINVKVQINPKISIFSNKKWHSPDCAIIQNHTILNKNKIAVTSLLTSEYCSLSIEDIWDRNCEAINNSSDWLRRATMSQ